MCRILAYLGEPLPVQNLLFAPTKTLRPHARLAASV